MTNLVDILKSLREEGTETVPIDLLIDWLEDSQSKTEEERFIRSLRHASELEQYKAKNISNLEMFKSVITLGHNALKATFLINGSAAVALLAFLGNIWARTALYAQAQGLVWALAFFCLGVLFSAIATGFTWWSQDAYAMVSFGAKPRKGASPSGCPSGDRFKIAAVICAIASFLAFLSGMTSSLSAFFKVF